MVRQIFKEVRNVFQLRQVYRFIKMERVKMNKRQKHF